MKKILVLFVLLIGVFCLTGCDNHSKDAKLFKKDYESLNGKSNAKDVEFRKVNIDEKNPFIMSSAKEVVEKIENKDTFIVYFGDKQCPWCRSVIEKFIEVSKDYEIDDVYYVAIWDDDHNEILRDKYIINDENKLELSQKGTKEYSKLLKTFDSLLSNYTLNDNEGNVVETGEKRIFAPNFIYVENGKAKYLTAGKSSLLDDPYGELTKEILEEQEDNFEEFFGKITNNYVDLK